ncbi:MAG: hypothetical protein J6Y13_11025 [Treponema sp.]|nr:hypothetical protein [Treponema sp.]
MNNLEISDNFTVDDIHKVREYNYEMTREMSGKERHEYYRSQAEEFLRSAGMTTK